MAIVEVVREFLELFLRNVSQGSEYPEVCLGWSRQPAAGRQRRGRPVVVRIRDPERRRQLYPALPSKCLDGPELPALLAMGRDKTMERLHRRYYWPGLSADVHTYVRTCPSCQKSKPGHFKPIGLLQPLPIPRVPWEQVSLDLITQLPACRGTGYDTIITFVDRLTKMIHLAPTTTV